MGKKIVAVILCLALVTPVFAGCQAVEEHPGAATGAGVGAGAGAVTGAIIGDEKGAIIGGLAGALIGGAIGHYAYDKQRTSEETTNYYDYSPGQGNRVTIESTTIMPPTARPGEKVDLRLTYAVLTPYPDNNISITETREITYQGELVGQPKVQVERTDGTYNSIVPLQLPTDAKLGQYRVRYTVQIPGASDSREATFEVDETGIPAYPPEGGTQ